MGASVVSRAETYIVAFKIAILILVVGAGLGGIDTSRIAPETWTSPLNIAGAGMMIFVAYEGFELIANTSANIKDAAKNLPRAYYTSVVFVIVLYMLIALVVVGAMSAAAIAAAQDFALAKAAEPSLGQFGFTVVGIAAVLATLSAINSTLYGAARLSYSIATEGELPEEFEVKVWQQPVGLIVTGVGALLLANLIDLSSISMMASASFLGIFGLVNLACFRKSKDIQSSRIVAVFGVVACALALFALIAHTLGTAASHVWILVGMIAFAVVGEGAYQLFRNNGRPDRVRRKQNQTNNRT
ncbi:MAG: APC family permease [bacterium]